MRRSISAIAAMIIVAVALALLFQRTGDPEESGPGATGQSPPEIDVDVEGQ